MSTPDNVTKAWQAYASDAAVPTVEEVRCRAESFDRRIRRGRFVAYGTGLSVILVFTLCALLIPNTGVKLACVLLGIGTCIMLWQMHRRIYSMLEPKDAATSGLFEHQRRNLVRQRDAQKSTFWWFLLPPVPGLITLIIATPKPPGREWVSFVLAAFFFATGLFTWLMNQREARKMQKTIDDIDRLMGEAE